MYKDELQNQIRYSIAQLSAQNGSADFEKICLFIARARIHPNILPATGPVQGGGDQGRDFETFHNYLSQSPIADSLFVGKFSSKPVAFACSLEKNPTKDNGKVVKDVRSIMKSGSEVERIYFFSGEDIPIARRHKCQEHIKKQQKVELEIFDAQAISQHLTDSDLFWIAVQYLKIPAEYFPKKEEENWYTTLLNEYKHREKLPDTFEEFVEIKDAIRHIYKSTELKSDLIFWLPKLDLIIEGVVPNSLKRRAIYEKFVASFIGLKDVSGQEENIKEYFADLEEYGSVSEIEDTRLLFSFCISSKQMIGHSLSNEFLSEIGSRLENLILSKLEYTESIDNKCFLLESYANLLFQNNREDIDGGEKLRKYFEKLWELLTLLLDTHFFSIEKLSDRLNEMIKALLKYNIDISKLEKITHEVDKILSKKGGKEVVAEKLRSRAVTYLESNEVFKAIATLHELKINWFKEDSLDGSITSCLLISDAYEKLNLFHAAKYYALIAAYLAITSKNVSLFHRTVTALAKVADCDYSTGAWMNFLDIIEFLIFTHYRITKDFDVYDHDDTHRILYYTSIVEKCAEKLFPEVVPLLEEKLSTWGFIKDDILEFKEKLHEKFLEEDKSKFLKSLNEEVDGKIFNDIGALRGVEFNAIGCDWCFSFENSYEINSIAEEFIAMFQILLADLHDEELYILSTKVIVEITGTNSNKPEIERVASNDEIRRKVSLPFYRRMSLKELKDHEFHYFIIAQTLLYEVSLLPFEGWKKVLDKHLGSKNLISHVTFGRPYSELYQSFISQTDFEKSKRWIFKNKIYSEPFKPTLNHQLRWIDSIAPDYDYNKSIEAIHNRLKNLQKPLSITLPLLKESEDFVKIVESLKTKGYLDWQILHVIATVIINHKVRFTTETLPKDVQSVFYDYYFKDEREWYEKIPLQVVNEERLEQELSLLFPVVLLHGFGLEQHSDTPNGEAIVHLLEKRFKYFEDGKEINLF